MIAASSIQGTGAQNFPIALRKGWSVVSGIALGPTFASRWRASSLDRPFCEGLVAVGSLAGLESAEAEEIVAAISGHLVPLTVDENSRTVSEPCFRSAPPSHSSAQPS
jgi:hypothetical protein